MVLVGGMYEPLCERALGMDPLTTDQEVNNNNTIKIHFINCILSVAFLEWNSSPQTAC